MARTGMANLIQRTRELANANVGDHTWGSVTYWTDDQIEEVLDDHRHTYKDIPLLAIGNSDGNTVTYLEYAIPEPLRWFEESGSGSGWEVRTSTDVLSPTINYEARIVTFASDTGGSTIYLDCRTYDIYQAAADILDRKANQAMLNVDWSSDNHSVKASQEAAGYKNMAAQYRSKNGGVFAKFVRTDVL